MTNKKKKNEERETLTRQLVTNTNAHLNPRMRVEMDSWVLCNSMVVDLICS